MLNLQKVLEEFQKNPLPPDKPIVYKLTYDPETMIVNGFTTYETDQPYIEITKEQSESGLFGRALRVVGNTFEEVNNLELKKLPLVEGDKWHTTESNMLIQGTEKGWDERKNN